MSAPTLSDPVGHYVGDRDFRLMIGGEFTAASDRGSFDTVNPSTGRVLTRVPAATANDVDRAVAAAAAAQPAWEALGLEGRRRVFVSLAAAIDARSEELAMLDSIEGGNPYSSLLREIRGTVDRLRQWPAAALTALNGETIPASDGDLHHTTYRPYGVVGRITPFNHPALFAIGKVIIPMIVGNTVVLKPAEATSLSALVFGELAAEVLPPGVLNVVSGGPATGEALVRHPAVKRIAFTGSAATALKIQRAAAEHAVKHLSLELGGKNAMLVFPDADLDEVVHGAVDGMNFAVSQGQSCGSVSRIFVHDALYEDFLAGVREQVARINVGCAYEPGTEMGPLVTEAHHRRVIGYVEAGRAEGARLVFGGAAPVGLDEGFFLAPTVFADVEMSMRIAREEIFGPVMSVLRWSDYESVIAAANDIDLGLAASVWTDDVHLAHRTADLLDAGYVWINETHKHYWGTPFGGFKNSGLGREEAPEELRSYCEIKAVHTIVKPQRALRALAARRRSDDEHGGAAR